MTEKEFVQQLFEGIDYIQHEEMEWYDGQTICEKLDLPLSYMEYLETDRDRVQMIDFGNRSESEAEAILRVASALPPEDQEAWISENANFRYFVNLIGVYKLIDWSESEFSQFLNLSYRMKKMGCLEN